jgi:DNA-directed RNA polymerase specialized sigma24 family protein|tara:strand:- start:5249 stop:5848 length:600 start_codon:yes stop_codon:yes gene_type:complete
MFIAHKRVIKHTESIKKMEINDDLILQWEPKINKMLSNIYIQGYDRDDLAQELRLIVLKAAKLYKPNRNAIFHTYLHTAMVNRLKTLWMQASKKLHGQSLDATTSDSDGENSFKLSDFVKQLDENLDEVEFIDYLESLDLDDGEKQFLKDKFMNRTMKDIEQNLKQLTKVNTVNGEESVVNYSIYKVKKSLRNKINEEK